MGDMRRALDDVRLAMDRFMDVLNAEIESAQKTGLTEDKMKPQLIGYIAIKDSGKIYLDWAHHYISQAFNKEELEEEEEGPVS